MKFGTELFSFASICSERKFVSYILDAESITEFFCVYFIQKKCPIDNLIHQSPSFTGHALAHVVLHNQNKLNQINKLANKT